MTPTCEQYLLLKAALLRGPAGIGAWQAWRTATSVDTLDSDSQWLLPLLYHNLHAQGVEPGELLRYRNVYLHNWYKNNLTLKRAEPAIQVLQRTSRSVVIRGGAAMAMRYYDALGARPFGPVGVLALAQTRTDDTHSSQATGDLDVQSSVFGAGVDEMMAERATVSAWKALEYRFLEPADQLLDICMHKSSWDQRSALFWMADSIILLRRQPDLDLDGVLAVASRLGCAAEMSESLAQITALSVAG